MASERRDPPFGGSVVFLLMNLPLGVAAFTVLTSLTAAGLGTVVVWVGVPLLALLVLGVRGAARMERARVYALLDRYIDLPYLPLPHGGSRACAGRRGSRICRRGGTCCTSSCCSRSG